MLVLASTNRALARTSTMRSMCLSSRCDATKLRPIPPKIQRSKASYVSLSSLWFFFFLFAHCLTLYRKIGKSTIQPRVEDSTLSQRVNVTEIHTQTMHRKLGKSTIHCNEVSYTSLFALWFGGGLRVVFCCVEAFLP